jgi:hypothetical protein
LRLHKLLPPPPPLLLLLLLLLCRHHLHILPCLPCLMLPGCTLLPLVPFLCLHWPGLLCRRLLSWRRCVIHWKVKSVLLLPQLGC